MTMTIRHGDAHERQSVAIIHGMATPPHVENELSSPAPRPRSWARRLLRLTVIGLLLIALLAVAAALALRSSGVRGALLGGVTNMLESRLGMVVSADDFALGVGGSRLSLSGVTLRRSAGDPPFMRADEADIDFTWPALFSAPRTFDRVVLRGFVWRLDAPGPAGSDTEDEGSASGPESEPPVIVESLIVENGEIAANQPLPGFERWFRAWRWRSVNAEGSFGDALRLRLEPAPLDLEGVDSVVLEGLPRAQEDAILEDAIQEGVTQEDVTLMLAGDLTLGGGGLILRDLRVTGDGVDLEARAEGSFEADAPFRVVATLDSQPGEWLAGVPATSRLDIAADLDVKTWDGTVQVDGLEVPADVLRPFLGAAGEALALAGTTVEAVADLSLNGRQPSSTRGTATLRWHDGDENLLTADVATVDVAMPTDDGRLGIKVEARILPVAAAEGSQGKTVATPASPTVTGIVIVSDDRSMAFQDVRARVASRNVDALLRRLRTIAPDVVDRLRARDVGIIDSLVADARIDGPVDDLDLVLDVAIEADGGQLDLKAEGGWPIGDARVELDARDLPIPVALAEALGLPLEPVTNETAPTQTITMRAEAARLSAEFDGQTLRLEEGRLAIDGRSARVEGTVRFAHPLLATQLDDAPPQVADADLAIEFEGAVPGRSRPDGSSLPKDSLHVAGSLHMAGSLRVVSGVLALDVESMDGTDNAVAIGPVTIEARVPIASLADVPALAAVPTFVTSPAEGRAEVRVRAIGFDSARWQAAITGAEPPAASVRGDLDVTADLDPADPLVGVARLRLDDADVILGERRLVADAPLVVDLGSGQLRIPEVAFEGADLDSDVTLPRLILEGEGTLIRPRDPDSDEVAVFVPEPLRLRLRTGRALDWRTVSAAFGIDLADLDAAADVTVDVALDVPTQRLANLEAEIVGLEGAWAGQAFSAETIRLTTEPASVASTPRALELAPFMLQIDDQHVQLSATAPLVSAPVSAPVSAAPRPDADPDPDSDTRVVQRASDGIGRFIGPVTVRLAAGPAVLGDDAPPLRLGRWLRLAGDTSPEVVQLGEQIETSLDAQFAFDLASWTESRGEARLPGLVFGTGPRRMVAETPAVLALAHGRVRLQPVRLVRQDAEAGDDDGLLLAAGLDLTPEAVNDLETDAATMDSLDAGAIAKLTVRLQGALPSSLVNPVLATVAGSASIRGIFDIDVDLVGAPTELSGHVRLAGREDARILMARPYLVAASDLQIDATLDDGVLARADGSAEVNRGTVRFTGKPSPGGGTDLSATLEDLRLRVDYGLSLLLDGDLRYRTAAGSGTEGGEISGEVVVERGQLRRALDLDRAVIDQLLRPPALSPSAPSTLRAIELDVTLRTEDGIRIKNNLADLRAVWSEVTIRGSLAEPLVRGRIDTDPDGYIYAYGQALRVDRGSVTFSGVPGGSPELDFVITSAADDPSISREGVSRFPVALRSESSTEQGSNIGSGVADYYLSRLAGQIGGSLGAFDVSVGENLLIFGETDPSRRLTVGRDVSPRVALAASFALDEEADTTYLLDLHDFAFARDVVAQVFTTDDEDTGATIQHVFELGRPTPEQNAQRIRRIEVQAPDAVGAKAIRRAAGVRKGDRIVPEDEAFDIEIDIQEHMRRRGYPGAEVAVDFRDAQRPGVVAELTVAPGPPVRYAFEGDRPSSTARQTIRSIYRPDFDESATLREIEDEAVKSFEAEGHLTPDVSVEVIVADSERPNSERTVVVRADAGPKTALPAPRFEVVSGSLPEPVREALAARFDDPLSRARIASKDPEMRAEIERSLAELALPEARVVSLGSPAKAKKGNGGNGLAVVVDAGQPQRIARLAIEGLPDADARRLLSSIELVVGDLALRPRIARGAVRLEGLLLEEGRAAARVELSIESVGTDVAVTFRVDDPATYRIAEVQFTGREVTRRRWAERAVGIDHGDLIRDGEVADARRALFEIGAFRSVVPTTELHDDGTGTIIFDVEERARYRVALGGRWSTDEGLATVFDFVDRNGFGRGVRLGLRARYADDEESLRGFGAVPNVFGTDASLELYVEGGERHEPSLETRRVESTLQVSVPHGKRTTSRYFLRTTDERVTDRPRDGGPPLRDRNRFPSVGFQWLHDSRDDRIESTRGTLVSLDLAVTDESLLRGDLSFFKLLVQARHFRRLGQFRTRPLIWAQSLAVGIADTFDGLPLLRSERFFAGGEFSVRGYEEESLGPLRTTASGDVIATGGEGLLVLNQELRVPISERFEGVLFVDAGNVYPELGDLGSELFFSAGFGVRVRTPFGLLRGDVAFPLDARPEDEDLEVYIGFGSSF